MSKSAITVLVVDDSRSTRALVLHTLRKAGVADTYIEAQSGLDGLRVLATETVSLVVCDLEMPGMGGLELVRTAKARANCLDIPFILLTAHDELDTKLKAFEFGASDYVLKPFFAAELVARVNAHLRLRVFQEELKRKNALLQQLATTDELTGLANRRVLLATAQHELDRIERYGGDLGVILADVDSFKSVNDQLGHAEGDRVLAEIARVLTDATRRTDLVARYGGEEIVILLPETSLSGSVRTAERIRHLVKTRVRAGGHAVTISMGVAHAPTIPLEIGLDGLLQAADTAMYEAKRAGRDRVCVSNGELLVRADSAA